MLRAILSVCMLAGALLAQNARALDMSVSQDDVGQLWLQLTGRIEDGDEARFKALLVEAFARGQHIENVATYSSGGQVGAAMKIGGYVRTLHMTTVAPDLMPVLGRHLCKMHAEAGRGIVTYDPRTHQGDARCTCSGECLLIWVAGLVRAGNAGQIRRIAVPEQVGAIASDASAMDMHADSRQAIEAYLRAAGASETTISRMFDVSPDKLEYLSKEERAALDASSLQRLNEAIGARCRDHAASSPAALACEKGVIRELYWRGAEQLSSQTE
jgi:hypothetical protein